MRTLALALVLLVLATAVTAVSFVYGAKYGSRKAVEATKQWWRERGRNTHNPHYRVTP